MRLGPALGSLACLAASTAAAENTVDLDRSVYVERLSQGARALEPITTLTKGDRVVLLVEWRAAEPGLTFTVQSSVPPTLAFQRAGNDGIEVSVDGGRRWGKLGETRLGARLASPEDVTHLRLRISGARTTGRMTYSAIVR